MSIRHLPELQAPEAVEGISFDLAPQALAAWDSGVTAASAKDENTISILEPIGADFFGEGVTAKRVAGILRNIGKKPVTVLINSPGGNFFDGLAIYNLLRNHDARVTVQVLGIAASAAAVVAMAGDDVQIAKAAMLMIHNSQWVAAGDRHTMKEAADQMAIFDAAMRGLFVDRTGLADKQVGSMMDATTFLGSEEAVEKGFADGLMPADEVDRDPEAQLEQRPVAYRIEAVLARHGVPRAERRRLIKDFTAETPRALGGDDGTPGAADCEGAVAHLRAAAMRLSLTT